MGTSFEDIYGLAKVTMIDYKIDKVIKLAYDAFLEYMRSLLTVGLAEFDRCLTPLDYEVVDGQYRFTNDLSIKEQSIISKIIVSKWWDTKIQDVVVFEQKIPSIDFKAMSIEAGLKQKSEYKDKLKEEIDKDINDYMTAHTKTLWGWMQ